MKTRAPAPSRGATPVRRSAGTRAAAATTASLRAFDLLLRAASELEQQVGQVLRPAEVTPAQYQVLRLLKEAGDAGLACSDLSALLVHHDPDVTRLLDRLEARAYVVRARDADDRRVVLARITYKGRAVLDTLEDGMAALHSAQFAALDRDELRTLMGLLERLAPPGA